MQEHAHEHTRAKAPVLTDHDVYLFREGTHSHLHSKLGCRLLPEGGAHFAVWAPNASAVSVIGDWNGWNAAQTMLQPRWDGSGIWEGAAPQAARGQAYKYRIGSQSGGFTVEKADPFATLCEVPPATASRIWSLEYEWRDEAWMAERGRRNGLDAPMSIYELHAGSWRRQDGRFMNYRELAHALGDYIQDLGFTHVELMPIT